MEIVSDQIDTRFLFDICSFTPCRYV